LFACSTRGQDNRDSGNGKETVLYAARPLLPQYRLTARHKRRNETLPYAAPLPLPEYIAEVMP